MLDRPSLPISEIVQIAANSALARVSWDGGRGRAPLGYIKGMAVMFAVALRKLAQGDPAAVEMARASSGDPSRDALAYYASEFARLGMRNDVSGIDTLRHLFVLMIGLGMRELSGRYCEGRDQSASNTSADTAEAGLFQMSWDAHGASRQIPRLLDEYQANGGGYREIFCEGVTPRRGELDNCGSGTGLQFQQLCKERPGFAVEAAAVGLRNRRNALGTHQPARGRASAGGRRHAPAGAAVDGGWPERHRHPPRRAGGTRGTRGCARHPVGAAVAQRARRQPAAGRGRRERTADDGGGAAIPAGEWPLPVRLRRCGNDRGDRAQVAPDGPGSVPSGPTDLIALLERLVMLIEKLKGQRPITDPSSGSSPTDRLRKTIELLSAILSPGAADKPQPLGQVNGALGQTDRQSARRQEDRDRPARRGGHAVAVACVRDDRARSRCSPR